MLVIFWIIFIAWILCSAVLILVVLVQSGKGGGLSGLVGAGSALGDHLGATGAEKTLNRWTTYFAVGFLVLNIAMVLIGPKAFSGSLLGTGGAPRTEQTTPGDISQPDISTSTATTAPAENPAAATDLSGDSPVANPVATPEAAPESPAVDPVPSVDPPPAVE